MEIRVARYLCHLDLNNEAFFPFSFLAILTIFPTDVLYDLSLELHKV